MSAATLHAVTKACQKPAPGLKAIAIIEPTDLSAQPVWYLEPSIASLSFLPGKAAFSFDADRLTARLTDKTATNERHGDRFDYLLQAFVSGVRPEVEFLRAKIRNRRYHVVVTYQDDTMRFLPFMRLSADGDSGDRSSKNGYSFTGTLRMHRPAPYLEATFDIIGGPYVPPTLPGAGGSVTIVELTATDDTYTYNIASGAWLVGWEITGDENQSVSLGLTASGSELGGPVDMLSGQTWVGQGNMTPTNTSFNIYFSGLAGNNNIKLWLLG